MHHLRTFRCIAHVKVNTPHLKKLADRSMKMIFVGYEPGFVAYMCYDPSTKRVHINKDVIFDEDTKWDWIDDQSRDMEFEFIVSDQTEYIQTTETHPSARENSIREDSVPVETNVGMQSAQKSAEEGGPGQTMSSPQMGLMTPLVGGVLTPQLDPEHQYETPPSDNLDAN
jgi:hypothetical protein